MTIDQMHNTLRYVREQLADERGTDFSGVEALDMVLEELEQEPSGDLISRQAVQDYIAKYLSQYLYNDVREAVEIIDEYIGELPSVNPQEPKTGHWIKSDIPNEEYVCSECGGGCWYYDYQEDVTKSKYCPNCGCRMVEQKGSEKTETWNGYHGQITAPKGTFERIFNDADDEDDI